MRLFPLPQNIRDLAYFVFNRPISGMILWPSNDAKPTRTLTPRDRLMDVRRVMCSQVFPNKNLVVVRSLHSKLLYHRAKNAVTKLMENVVIVPQPWIHRIQCRGC